mgnify:CR=1 FL=1
MPKVSVIVPIYNVEKYLEQCVDSILEQTLQDIEIILVDDGSPDNCGYVCDCYGERDNRITVIHKENGGLSDARNAGLRVARGEYVLFVDSDDYLCKEAIEILYYYSKYNDLDILNFDAISFYDDENVVPNINKVNEHNRLNVYDGIFCGASYLTSVLCNKDYRPPVQYYLYRKTFLEARCLEFHKGIVHEDEEFSIIALLYAEKVMHIPCVLYYHRLRDNSIMGVKLTYKNLSCFFEVLNKILSLEDDFIANEKTKTAFVASVAHIIERYLYVYRHSEYDVRKKSQYFAIIEKIKDKNCYNNSELCSLIYPNRKEKIKNRIKMIFGEDTSIFFKMLDIRNLLRLRFGSFDEECIRVLEQLQSTKNQNKKRYIVICVPHMHGNRGDIAISLAQRNYLERIEDDKLIIEIPTYMCEFRSGSIVPLLKRNDVIFVCGGGWFGSLWRHNEVAAKRVLKNCKDNKIIVFPQTIYYTEDETGDKQIREDKKFFSKFSDMHIFVRDMYSYEFVKKERLFGSADIKLIPDMVLSYDSTKGLSSKSVREGVLVCLRKDEEAVLSVSQQNNIYRKLLKLDEKLVFISTNYPNDSIPLSRRKEVIEEMLFKYSASKLVITDRLHCMLFAAITGTPCVAFDNRTGKIRGVYEWIKEQGYIKVISYEDDLEETIREVLKQENKWNSNSFGEKFSGLRESFDNG